MARTLKPFRAEYRWRSASDIGPRQTFDNFYAGSLAEARRIAKSRVGEDGRTWLDSSSVRPGSYVRLPSGVMGYSECANPIEVAPK